MHNLQIDSELKSDTKLYRYMSVEAFVAFLETKRTTLTNVNTWDDKWEVILSKIPVVNEEGIVTPSLYSFHERIFAQCWSVADESDAMWRIYSPGRTGVQIQTTVAKFNLIGEIQRGYLGNISYFATATDLVERTRTQVSPFDDALFKRIAFQHEREVRFLTHGDFIDNFSPGATHISLPVDPQLFIEAVTIDPRSDDWYVDALEKYCTRFGLPAKPTKSDLYESDPHLKLGLVRRYIRVHHEE